MKITIEIGETKLELTIEQAEQLHNQLAKLFAKPSPPVKEPYNPWVPYGPHKPPTPWLAPVQPTAPWDPYKIMY